MGNLLVIGSINMDMTIFAPRIPRAGETLSGQGFLLSPGGKGANQAVAASKMGANTMMCGCVGEDAFGRELTQSLALSGIDVRPIRMLPDVSTGVAAITVVDGDNRIILHDGANALVTLDHEMESLIEQCDALMMQLEIPLQTVFGAIDIADRYGKSVFLTPAPAVTLPKELYSKVRFLLPNESEASILLGRELVTDEDIFWALGAFCDLGVKEPVITLGERGVGCLLDGKPQVRRSYRVEPLDTTAAGDTFTGALAAMITDGKTLAEAIDIAQRAASICVTRPGAQNAIPTLSEVLEAK